jgi:hypothetical protein
MYCRKCGQGNDDNAFRCVRCGEIVQDLPVPPAGSGSRGQGVEVPNHLALAIVATLFCCLPCGVVAIVYANQVNGAASAGDIAGAEEASRQAQLWGWIGVGLGVVVWVVYFGLSVMGVMLKR